MAPLPTPVLRTAAAVILIAVAAAAAEEEAPRLERSMA